jgi:hypothetical protein
MRKPGWVVSAVTAVRWNMKSNRFLRLRFTSRFAPVIRRGRKERASLSDWIPYHCQSQICCILIFPCCIVAASDRRWIAIGPSKTNSAFMQSAPEGLGGLKCASFVAFGSQSIYIWGFIYAQKRLGTIREAASDLPPILIIGSYRSLQHVQWEESQLKYL